MDHAERKRALAKAKELERTGLSDRSVRLYLQAGAVDEAARVLVAGRRYADAGNVLVRHLGLRRGAVFSEEDVAGLSPKLKRRALHAAICFARAGEHDLAKKMFLALGEVQRAVELLQQAGDSVGASKLAAEYRRRGQYKPLEADKPEITDLSEITMEGAQRLEADGKHERAMEAYIRLRQPAHAARMARMLQRPKQAASLFADAGMSYESALCQLEIGDTGRALENFIRVPRTDPRYREAAIQAVNLASQQGVLDFQLENFLARFLDEPPQTPREADVFRTMAELYVRHDFVENAKQALRLILSAFANHDGSAHLLAELESEGHGSEMVYKKILNEDLSFKESGRRRRRSAKTDASGLLPLPDLPDLPDLPPAPARGGGRSRGVRQRVAQPDAPRRNAGTEPRQRPVAPAALAQDERTVQIGSVPPDLYTPVTGPEEPAATEFASESQLRKIPGLASAKRRGSTSSRTGRRKAATEPPVTQRPRGGVTLSPDDDVPSMDDLAFPEVDHAPDLGSAEMRVESVDPSDMYPSFESVKNPTQNESSQGPPPDFDGFEVGMVLNERYRFEAKLGQGGMATVYKAFDLELDEYVAIKIFNRPISDENAIKRFKQELSLSRKLLHPNIIRLYDIGSSMGFRFITMELLVGRDLFHHLGQPIAFSTGIDWLVQICDGLQAAHDKGVIHRDIKPHNIFVQDDGSIKVMDFGIAKSQHAPGMTVGNMIAGTPEYMSPEQISGFSSVTHSTDLYALGIVAYQMFTAKVPFAHKDMLPLLMMHINERPMPPGQLNDSLPDELERIILRLLEKRPEDRFASCSQLADALRMLQARL